MKINFSVEYSPIEKPFELCDEKCARSLENGHCDITS